MSNARIAALYDIHGNLPALEAVLEEVRSLEVDLIVVGGDVVPGPMPADSLDALLHAGIPIQCIRGNGEREVLADLDGEEMLTVPEAFRPMMHWTAQQIPRAQQRVLRNWPGTLRLDVLGLGEVLFCHATPRNDVDMFTLTSPGDAALSEMLGSVDSSLVVCGHTHRQFERVLGDVRIVNAGSVGMALEGPGARWLLLDRTVQLRCTAYEVGAAATRIRATHYPRAEEFIAGPWMGQ